MMDERQLQPGDSVIVRPGEQYEELNLDISGWRGCVVDIDEDDDLLIAWDSKTLSEIPETAVAALLEDEIDWTCLYIEPEAVLPYEPRGEVAEALAVARARTDPYGIVFDDITDNPLFYDLIDADWDDEWDEEWDDDDWTPKLPAPYFDLDQFLYGLEIPTKEHPHVRRALSKGLGQYFFDVYGRYEHGKEPANLIPNNMGIPFVFGYGAMAILDHKQISQDTKSKICQHALTIVNPISEDGLPYGFVTLLGYLAETGNLLLPLFQLGMVTLEFGGVGSFRRSAWQFGTRREAVLNLLNWLAIHPDISDDEKLFWVWRWSLENEFDPHLAKALANAWLAHPNVPNESKRKLCWAWLQEAREVGTPPPIWQVMNAFISGDRTKLEQLLADMSHATGFPFPVPEIMPPAFDDGDDGRFFQLLHNPHFSSLIPAPLMRIAIPALARLGDDPQTVAETFWGSGSFEYYIDAIHNGIADLLREFQAQIPPAELRHLVEQGLEHGRANVRKTFHVLAQELYGDKYLPLALHDKTKVLRTWAEKQMRK